MFAFYRCRLANTALSSACAGPSVVMQVRRYSRHAGAANRLQILQGQLSGALRKSPSPQLTAADLDTPSLLVDLDALSHNIAAIAAFAKQHRLLWRPHTKAVRCAEIAKRMIQAGACGGKPHPPWGSQPRPADLPAPTHHHDRAKRVWRLLRSGPTATASAQSPAPSCHKRRRSATAASPTSSSPTRCAAASASLRLRTCMAAAPGASAPAPPRLHRP